MDVVIPKRLLEAVPISSGMRVLDVGAGSGAYALAAAQLVGDAGKVYALDVHDDLLLRLNREAERAGHHALVTIWGDIEMPRGSTLKDGSVDVVLLANVLYQIDDSAAALTEVRRVLKSKGIVVVIERSPGVLAPNADQMLPNLEVRSLLQAAGFRVDRELPAGNYHYCLLARI